ncbi:MAG TPA: hypothetical protein VJV78_09495 [Polyangiales bacterium]|nr:hypothetical protein [Polyangiales bacterium]
MCRRRDALVGLTCLWLGACAGDEIAARQQPGSAAGASAQPPAAGDSAGSSAGGLVPGVTDAGSTMVVLPDDDGGAVTLPSSQAKKPPADPKITFDWTESQPSTLSCEPGEYVGKFSCVFTLDDEVAALLGGTVQLEGDLRLTLVRSMNGEFLEITDGRFEAVAASIIGARAMLSGKLDCRTNRFQASLSDGLWAVGDPAMPVLPGGMLEGDITGMYRDRMLSGEWTLGDPMLGDCVGTWTASLTP